MLSLFKNKQEDLEISQIEDLDHYIKILTHSWLKTLTILGFTLVPIFFLLDYFIIPMESRNLLPRFGIYRAVSTAIVLLQFFVLIFTKPSKYSFLHGYVFNIVVGMAIILMTKDLGGFSAPYYAGLNLVIMAVNLLPPWSPIHSVINGMLIITLYVITNLFRSDTIIPNHLINNLYFMASTVIITSSINYVKYILVKKEFYSRSDLKKARDALFSEMEIAKKLQTVLLPSIGKYEKFDIAAKMMPADEVGGDYYDIIESKDKFWVIIGDVSGHGVEAGLIMMMAQTGIKSAITQEPNSMPSKILSRVNRILKENIERLGVERYMTINAIQIDGANVVHAGHHQEIIVYRDANHSLELVPTRGTWIGFFDDVDSFLSDNTTSMGINDIFLLYTDGITEMINLSGEMYGQERLEQSFLKSAQLSVNEILDNILNDVFHFSNQQADDISVIIIKRTL